MDRNEYLKLCKKASMYTSKLTQIPSNLLVKHAEIVYCPYGYEMTFDKGITRNTAILKDLKANAMIYADLERIEKNGKE